MHEHTLFIGNVLAHLVALMSGIASFAIATYEAVKSKPIRSRTFWVIGSVCLVIAFNQAWRDEHHNSQLLIDQKAEAWSKYNSCDKQLAVASSLNTTYYGQIADQRTRLDGQQDTFNRCILAIGVKAQEPPRLTTFWAITNIKAQKPDGSMSALVAVVSETNRRFPSVDVDVKCNVPFSFNYADLPGGDLFVMQSNHQTSPNTVHVSINSAWSPGIPLVATLAVDADLKTKAVCETRLHG
jgi:hypothetical protein